MGRSSRCLSFWLALALLPTAAPAQVYGFPGADGVLDDGFGTLPPTTPPPALPLPDEDSPLPAFRTVPAPRPPCALIIQIGRGLRHRATTRVVYGHPASCR